MYRNFKTFSGSFNDDGSLTVRLQGVETFPLTDTQGAAVSPAPTGNTVEITVADPTRIAQFVTAFQGAAQDDATASNVRNRLNGSATEYTKPA